MGVHLNATCPFDATAALERVATADGEEKRTIAGQHGDSLRLSGSSRKDGVRFAALLGAVQSCTVDTDHPINGGYYKVRACARCACVRVRSVYPQRSLSTVACRHRLGSPRPLSLSLCARDFAKARRRRSNELRHEYFDGNAHGM